MNKEADITRATKWQAVLSVNAMLGMALVGCNTSLAADCDPATIGYVESRLDLDYRGLAPSPVAEILSQAEAERIRQSDNLSAFSGSQRNEFTAK